MTVRRSCWTRLMRKRVGVQHAIVVENEIASPTEPLPPEGVVIWGNDFAVSRAGSLPRLQDTDLHKGGDIDANGFTIPNQPRAWLPQAQSLLMDRETLVAHRDPWVSEPAQTRAKLDRLRGGEARLQEDLVGDRLGGRIRLEQERIDRSWVEPSSP